jgi:hypothetical protein
VDYRKFNAVTTRDIYPLTLIESALTRLQGSTVFTSLDLESGFWQMPLREVDRPKSAFITPDGLWQFKFMPFGLASASASFQRMIDLILAGLKWTSCLTYIDDVIVYARDHEEHRQRLREVFLCFQNANAVAVAEFFVEQIIQFSYRMQLVAGRDRKIVKNQKPFSDF